MASRKDNRGRVLQKGEYQRKDGRYQYSYYNPLGERKFIYANSLPELRELEREYLVASYQGAGAYGTTVTLNFMYDRFMATKIGLKESSYASYLQMYDRYVRDEFGQQLVKSIKYSDIQAFYAYLLKEKKLSIRSIEYVHKQISPALELAVADGIILKNPSKNAYGNFKRASGKYARVRHALTIEQQRTFLNYIDGHPTWGRYHSIFQIMLGTGLRVGELCGLRWQDIDIERRTINVNHGIVQIKAIRGGPKEHLKISLPKTAAGIRTVPIMEPVVEAFKDEYLYAELRGFPNCTIDGYTDFIFLKQNGTVYTSNRLDKVLKDIVKSYNKEEEKIAEIEDREPLLLPEFSNHILRHTFCTRLCERDVNIKTIQSIMGHSSIKITMDIYAEVSEKKMQDDMNRLAEELNVF